MRRDEVVGCLKSLVRLFSKDHFVMRVKYGSLDFRAIKTIYG